MQWKPHDPDISPHLVAFKRFIGGGCVSAMEGRMTSTEIAHRWDSIAAPFKTAAADGSLTIATLQIAQKRLANLIYEIDREAIIQEIEGA